MPEKGTTLKCGPRVSILTKELYRRFKKANPQIKLTWDEFSEIVNTTNQEIQNWTLTNKEGFKLPLDLGYKVVCKYQPKKNIGHQKDINYAVYNSTGQIVPNLNTHSFGYKFKIQWFKFLSQHKQAPIEAFDFAADRNFNRSLSQKIFSGTKYEAYRELDYQPTNR